MVKTPVLAASSLLVADYSHLVLTVQPVVDVAVLERHNEVAEPGIEAAGKVAAGPHGVLATMALVCGM